MRNFRNLIKAWEKKKKIQEEKLILSAEIHCCNTRLQRGPCYLLLLFSDMALANISWRIYGLISASPLRSIQTNTFRATYTLEGVGGGEFRRCVCIYALVGVG